jgi:hypothetical protein
MLLDTLSIESVLEMLGVSKDNVAGSIKSILAGRLLKEKADILSATDHAGSIECFHKALGLYLRGILSIGYTEMELAGYYADVRAIEDELGDLISEEDRQLLSKLHKKVP